MCSSHLSGSFQTPKHRLSHTLTLNNTHSSPTIRVRFSETSETSRHTSSAHVGTVLQSHLRWCWTQVGAHESNYQLHQQNKRCFHKQVIYRSFLTKHFCLFEGFRLLCANDTSRLKLRTDFIIPISTVSYQRTCRRTKLKRTEQRAGPRCVHQSSPSETQRKITRTQKMRYLENPQTKQTHGFTWKELCISKSQKSKVEESCRQSDRITPFIHFFSSFTSCFTQCRLVSCSCGVRVRDSGDNNSDNRDKILALVNKKRQKTQREKLDADVQEVSALLSSPPGSCASERAFVPKSVLEGRTACARSNGL